MIILQLFDIKVCQESLSILYYFSSLFLEIISSHYLYCSVTKLSPFLQGWQRRRKRFVHLMQKTHLLHSFILTCYSWLPHDCMLIEISQNYRFVCLFAFKRKSYPWDLLVIFCSLILKDQRNLISISFAFCTSVIPLFLALANFQYCVCYPLKKTFVSAQKQHSFFPKRLISGINVINTVC